MAGGYAKSGIWGVKMGGGERGEPSLTLAIDFVVPGGSHEINSPGDTAIRRP